MMCNREFELTIDFADAFIEASKLVNEFSNISNKELIRVDYPEIDSPKYGFIHSKTYLNFNEDSEAKFVFVYIPSIDDFEVIYVYPSSKRMVVWNDNKGALNPITGKYELADGIFENSHSIIEWKIFYSKISTN